MNTTLQDEALERRDLKLSADNIIAMWRFTDGNEQKFRLLYDFVAKLEFEAETAEKAVEMALNPGETSVRLCECEDPDINEAAASEIAP